MMEEPYINVGIVRRHREVAGRLNGPFLVEGSISLNGGFRAHVEGDMISLADAEGRLVLRGKQVRCAPLNDSTFTLSDVTIGIHFHWERRQEQTFRGELLLLRDSDDSIAAVNKILLEDYITSVISSEMSSDAPPEFLKAHAIASRSWLMSVLREKGKDNHSPTASAGPSPQAEEFIRYYNRAEHGLFDVCADDHCQRYQGITQLISKSAEKAVEETRGHFLVYGNEICDARYHKACGGMTDDFANTWESIPVPYLISVPDSFFPHDPIRTEEDARQWILRDPEAYCNTKDRSILQRILPSFDQETTNFFRWKVTYTRTELGEIIRDKSGIDFGNLEALTPIQRGPSGRIARLLIKGTSRTMIVGKELEIRRWLSRSHLYSSAFIVHTELDKQGYPVRFILHGAGWGHGVGLCQIGAAVMALRGLAAESILRHYFSGAELKKLY